MSSGRVPSTFTTSPKGAISVSQRGAADQGDVITGSRAIDEVQRRLRTESAPASGIPWADGNFFPDQTILAGVPKAFQHRLGRQYKGFIVLNMRAATASIVQRLLYALPAVDPDIAMGKFQITLDAPVDTTFDLWVF